MRRKSEGREVWASRERRGERDSKSREERARDRVERREK
jgi:hypothetical protein